LIFFESSRFFALEAHAIENKLMLVHRASSPDLMPELTKRELSSTPATRAVCARVCSATTCTYQFSTHTDDDHKPLSGIGHPTRSKGTKLLERDASLWYDKRVRAYYDVVGFSLPGIAMLRYAGPGGMCLGAS
jgi:hypothetical protein